MQFKILVLSALLMGCATTTPPTPVSVKQEVVSFDKLQPLFQAACDKSVGKEQSEFCSCVWERTTEIYSADEIARGLANSPKLKLNMWRLAVRVTCIHRLKH